jgi:hypothetical protein
MTEVAPRELLETLVHQYRSLQNDHAVTPPESGTRRRTEERLLDIRDRFERTLAEWVPDEEAQQAWREYLVNHGPAPSEPPAVRPLRFRGVSDAGSVVEVRGGNADEFEVEIDGSLVARVAAAKDLARVGPSAGFRFDSTVFEETFEVSDDALQALSDFQVDGGSPPYDHAVELLSDGLIDTHFGVTPRGRRALNQG